MIFRDTWKQVLDGTKTQTRRLKKIGDDLVIGMTTCVYRNGRLKWQVGRMYAIQQKRGKAGVGHFTLMAIRAEKLQAITDANAIAEGVKIREHWWILGKHIDSFMDLWNSIHKKIGDRWQDNPEVWVLTMEPVKP